MENSDEHEAPPSSVEREQRFSIEQERRQRSHYRRKEDKERVDTLANIAENVRNTPLTINKLLGLLSLFVVMNQGINWWRSNNVEPAVVKSQGQKVERLASSFDSLTRALREQQTGQNFFYYSICFSWKQKFPSQYPSFCDQPQIRQFDPLGRDVPSVR